MSKPKTDLAPKIRERALEMLLEKEPEEISMRDIAKACGVTATSIYYYYKDKEELFTEIKLLCIEEMNKFIAEQTVKKIQKYKKQGKRVSLQMEIKAGLEAFRDWAFKNPRVSILVMGRLKPDTKADPEKMKRYYKSTYFAKSLFDKAVQTGLSNSKDTLLDANLAISALWGAIETVLLNRTMPKYWSKRGGIEFTDKMIGFILSNIGGKK